MKHVVFYTTLLVLLALAGCAPGDVVNKVDVVGDSFCRVAKKIDWSIDDTQLTVDQVRRHNARVDSCREKAVS
jgi:hypothetical protein